eukprot:6191166-Pleurochrysis_carterae.AAC.1
MPPVSKKRHSAASNSPSSCSIIDETQNERHGKFRSKHTGNTDTYAYAHMSIGGTRGSARMRVRLNKSSKRRENVFAYVSSRRCGAVRGHCSQEKTNCARLTNTCAKKVESGASLRWKKGGRT